jgi:NADPH-dependent 2,4-dienoyl-CoA reductase/sulfur reductase-like enzyme/TusA-related sulfurtransferase/rhodanese-related sulfurtransferase
MPMKLLIVGGVAGGASAATRARRLNEHAEIILFERGEFVSFANCGLPYYIGNEIKDRDDLLVTTTDLLKNRFNIDVRTFNEVVDIDTESRTVTVRDVRTDDQYTESYDKLILSPGGLPIRPPLDGIDLDTVFTLWTIPDSDRIKSYIDQKKPTSAVVIGGGFIGIEMAENLTALGVRVTIVEMLDQVMPPLDFEMCSLVHRHLVDNGVNLHLGDGVRSFRKENGYTVVSTASGTEFVCDMVMLCIGVRPENMLAKKAGLDLGDRGGIRTNPSMQTSDPNIYAAGDAVEVRDFISDNPSMMPLAGPANKQGRVAADNIFGRNSTYDGTQGSAVVKVFDLTVAMTGNNEKLLRKNGTPHLASYTQSGSHASYYPGAQNMNVKLLFSPDEGRILGAQIVGMKGVDKRMDVLATAIRGGLTVYDLEHLELVYAPPFSSAKDPVNMAGFVACNILKGDVENVYWNEIDELDWDRYMLLDVRENEEVEMHPLIHDAVHIPLNVLRSRIHELEPYMDKTIIAYCAMGLRGYIACRMITQHGYTCKNLSGGFVLYMAPKAELTVMIDRPAEQLEFAEGCLNSFDIEMNACGIPCTGAISKLAERMKQTTEGQIVKVLASDGAFARDAMAWSERSGNEFITFIHEKGITTALIRKGKTEEEPQDAAGEACGTSEADGFPEDQIDFYLNACGIPCPGPIMKLARKFKEIEVGQVVHISASDVGFSRDVPRWCVKTGNELLSYTNEKGLYIAVIRKGKK